LMHLGLVRDAARFIQEQDVAGAVSRWACDEHTAPSRLPSPGLHLAPPARSGDERSLERPFVLVAGMRHSGSTALYNVIRVAMGNASVPFVAGYAEQAGAKQTALSSEV